MLVPVTVKFLVLSGTAVRCEESSNSVNSFIVDALNYIDNTKLPQALASLSFLMGIGAPKISFRFPVVFSELPLQQRT